ncbi:MAG: hypothetical protein L6U99_05855 [Clostridium sp.]|nr:MAG: hypothetical protein L6U99_05855 [Clostridium sp.]
MISEDDKKKIVQSTVIEILKLEKYALNQLSKPAKIKMIEDITAKFEEEYSKYENK